VTGLVDALVADGLVTREPHPTDRRATLVTLTPRGKTLVAQLRCDHKRLARALFASMSRREFDGFARALSGLIDRLRAHLAMTGSTRSRPSSAADTDAKERAAEASDRSAARRPR
jgi:hypothetical protein